MGIVGCPAPTKFTLHRPGPTVIRVFSAFIHRSHASDFGWTGIESMRVWKIELAGPIWYPPRLWGAVKFAGAWYVPSASMVPPPVTFQVTSSSARNLTDVPCSTIGWVGDTVGPDWAKSRTPRMQGTVIGAPWVGRSRRDAAPRARSVASRRRIRAARM